MGWCKDRLMDHVVALNVDAFFLSKGGFFRVALLLRVSPPKHSIEFPFSLFPSGYYNISLFLFVSHHDYDDDHHFSDLLQDGAKNFAPLTS